MMALLRSILFPQRVNAGREPAGIGAEKRRAAMVCAVAQRMRRELGLPPSPALQPTTNKGD